MFKDSFRLFKILNTLLKARLDKELETFTKPKIISFLLFISPWRLYSSKKETGERLKIALEDLGPIFIKFGQILSTRKDLFSQEMSLELEKLQDQVPPFDSETAIKIIEGEIKSPITSVFTSFDLDCDFSSNFACF